jgi:hypothetical protein
MEETSAKLREPLLRTRAIAYMDVGEGRELGAEALIADCA